MRPGGGQFIVGLNKEYWVHINNKWKIHSIILIYQKKGIYTNQYAT